MYVDGWLEDSWCASTSDTTDGKPKACQEPCILQINPSYGVLPSIPESTEEEAKEAKTKAAVYVNDPKQGMAVDNVYANDPKQSKAIVEEYEYIDVSPTSTEHSQILKQQTLTYNDSELSADYEDSYI